MSDNTVFKNPIVVEEPIHSITYSNNFIIAAAGGGGKKFGVKNYLYSFRIKKDKISDKPTNRVEFDQLPYVVKAFHNTNILCVCLANKIELYNLNISDGSMTKIIEKSLITSTNDYLSAAATDLANGYLSIGSETGKVW